jgi:hypothetical protein
MTDTNTLKGTVAVCTPMCADTAHRAYLNSVLLLADALRAEGYAMNLVTLGHDGETAKAKNLLINIATKSEDLLGVLFLDSNVGVNFQDVLAIIESGKDVIGALVPQKIVNWEQVKNAITLNKTNVEDYSGNFDISLVDDKEINVSYDEPIPVNYVSSDLMYISARAISELKDKCKTFRHTFNGNTENVLDVVEYFKSSISQDTGEFLSDDKTFCELWRSAGGDVWVAPWAQPTRSGDYTFSGSFLQSVDLLSDIKKLTM